MIERELPLDENMGESFPAMRFDFPYIWFWGEVDEYIGGHIPWHWHEEPEFCHVLQGEVEYHLPQQTIVLTAGEGIFINANVLHMICSHNGCKNAIIVPQVFHELLLTGYHRSAIDVKYYRPITNAQNLPCYIMHPQNPDDAAMIRIMDNCYKCAGKEELGYELYVRTYISMLWFRLYNSVQPILRTQTQKQDKHNARLKQMLQYINEHYAENITLKEIAASANISERECIRCFRKCMQLSPFQYLQQYRIDLAANMLLHSDLPITEIALENGFQTSSYFSKTFKQYMHCTPRMYRNTSRQNQRLTCRIDNASIDEEADETNETKSESFYQ